VTCELLKEILNKYNKETEWIEFKENNREPHMIGEYISALSNSPEIAIRELIANALIHQDFSAKGTNPMIEIFDNRIEISNAGKPLIDVLRLIDSTINQNQEMKNWLT
jgi:predicted HTH transcriptional regulator